MPSQDEPNNAVTDARSDRRQPHKNSRVFWVWCGAADLLEDFHEAMGRGSRSVEGRGGGRPRVQRGPWPRQAVEPSRSASALPQGTQRFAENRQLVCGDARASESPALKVVTPC